MSSCKRSGILLLIFLILYVSGTALAAGLSPFSDVPDSHWALPHIMKMELRGVITGYGNNIFKPDNTVTQLEAATMAVRAMGLQSETERTDLNIDVSHYNLPTSWNAAGYVKVALTKGIIDSTNFVPQSAASRAWVAQLMIRMIDAEDELKMDASTNFDDDSTIPGWAKSYVALAAEKGLITGIENFSGGYSFVPNNPVKRSELAAMISRADRYMSDVKGQLPVAEIVSVGYSTLTLKQAAQAERTYQVTTGTAVFDVNAKRSTITQLKAGDLIRYYVNGQGVLIYIEQLNKEHYQSRENITGKVAQHFPSDLILTIQSSEGKLYTYPYAKGILSEDLQAGDVVTITVKDGVITAIRLDDKTGELIRGKIFSLDLENNILTLEADGRYASYLISANVSVNYDGARFPTVKDLAQGDEVEITIEDNKVIAITLVKALNKKSLSGKIVGIAATEQVLTIRTTDDELLALEVPGSAVITIGGILNPLFSDLKVDDVIDFTIEDNVIVSLAVTNRGYKTEVMGKVEALNVSTKVIVLEDELGELQSYRIDNNVYLDLNKTSPTLSDIKVGMIVTLKLQDNIVYEINLQNKIKGEIEQIDSQRAIITVKTDAGRKNYKIDNALIRILGVTNARIRDLEVGQQVVLTLVEGSVDRVDVITTKISTVTTIETTANRIGIKDGSSTARYYVYPDTTIVISGIKNPSLRDLKTGDTVKLTFVGRELQQIKLVPARFGTITSLSLLASRIVVQTNSGAETISINDNVTVYSADGKKLTVNSLKENDFVRILATDEGIIITLAKTIKGEVVAVDFSTRTLYILDEKETYQWYTLIESVPVWEKASGHRLQDLATGTKVEVYLFDNQIYGICVLAALG
ncbi:MAG: S-layer homology domain-containing protein [Firmicutes bacterium]|nr:S-layer homology domain-containing protein [Bacillota bacterium]